MRAIAGCFTSPLTRIGWAGMVLLLVAATSGFAQEDPAPIVVAVDTSRSLSAAELKRTTDSVLQVFRELGDARSIGVLAFDDTPRWVMEPPGAVSDLEDALVSLTPRGDYTVLNDALFTAARRLPDGGVILLLTDGRDENSATTVEDVAGLCVANGIRVVSASTGRWVDEKAMRRYALLSDGEYVGRFDETAPETVAAKLSELHQSVENRRQADRTAAALMESKIEHGAEETQPPGTPVLSEPIVATPWWLLPGLLLLLFAVAVALFLLWRLRRQPVTEIAGNDEEWETDPAITPGDGIGAPPGLFGDLDNVPPNAKQADELNLDPSAFERLPFDGDIDKTSVLDEQPVLTVMEPGKPLRTFRLSRDRAFAVGRAPKVNTLTLNDRTLSGQHFKIVPHEGGFVLVDLEATNGTLLNGRRVRARLLDSGDSIRAGEVEFEFKTILKSLG